MVSTILRLWREAEERAGETVVFGIAGPTAVGKTALSLDVAEAMGAEIVSADSRQIYERLDIVTAKPSADELRAARHHFISELPLDAPESAVSYAMAATSRIAEIRGRGNRVLVVGGSTLYLDALLRGLPGAPQLTLATRHLLAERLAVEGLASLAADLAACSPESAAATDLTNPRRVVHALGILLQTGSPLMSFPRRIAPDFPTDAVILARDRSALYERIETRVDAMLEAGLLDEVAQIRAEGWDPSLPSLQTIGFKEPSAYFDGEVDRETMIALLKRNTRRYAKRQLTYFRNQWSGFERLHLGETA